MSIELPETVDAWRLVVATRVFEGRLPLSSMPRLCGVLDSTEGDADYVMEFGRDAFQVPFVALRVEAGLPLQCQRTLQAFVEPVRVEQRFGLVRDEVDEAALPPGYEALLVPDDGILRPADLVEDELLLAVPLVPVAPGSEAVERDWPVSSDEETRANPFAALQALKKNT